jgi:hypothetical protein
VTSDTTNYVEVAIRELKLRAIHGHVNLTAPCGSIVHLTA